MLKARGVITKEQFDTLWRISDPMEAVGALRAVVNLEEILHSWSSKQMTGGRRRHRKTHRKALRRRSSTRRAF